MNHSIPAIFAAGVFRPLEPVDLAEGTRAEVTPVLTPDSPTRKANNGLSAWPPNYFAQTAGALAGEIFDRPPQGNLPKREGW